MIRAANKFIMKVVSDTHFGSFYNGFQKYPDDLTDDFLGFLDLCSEDSTESIAFLGDVIDLWSFPIAQVPSSIMSIVEEDPNLISIFDRLRELNVDSGIQYLYVKGNHDKDITDSEIIDLFGPNTIICDAFSFCGVFFEHGHRFDIFCQPVHPNLYIEDYPLAYFLTRYHVTDSQGDIDHSSIASEVNDGFGIIGKILLKDTSKTFNQWEKKIADIALSSPKVQKYYLKKVLFPNRHDEIFRYIADRNTPNPRVETISVAEVIDCYSQYIPNRFYRIPRDSINSTVLSQASTLLFGDLSLNFFDPSNYPPEDCEVIITGHVHYLYCQNKVYERWENGPTFQYLNCGTWKNRNYIDLELEVENMVCSGTAKLVDWGNRDKEIAEVEIKGRNVDEDALLKLYRFRLNELTDERSDSCTDIELVQM